MCFGTRSTSSSSDDDEEAAAAALIARKVLRKKKKPPPPPPTPRVSQLPPMIPSTVMLPARAACASKLTLGLYRNSVVEEPTAAALPAVARTAAFREASWLFK